MELCEYTGFIYLDYFNFYRDNQDNGTKVFFEHGNKKFRERNTPPRERAVFIFSDDAGGCREECACVVSRDSQNINFPRTEQEDIYPLEQNNNNISDIFLPKIFMYRNRVR